MYIVCPPTTLRWSEVHIVYGAVGKQKRKLIFTWRKAAVDQFVCMRVCVPVLYKAGTCRARSVIFVRRPYSFVIVAIGS